MMRGMVIDINDEQLFTLADLQGFLKRTVAMDLAVAADERYDFITRTVRRFHYGRPKRADKAVVLRFRGRVSGDSRQQITRLVKRGGERRPFVKRYRSSRTSFVRTDTGADLLLLAHTDTLHVTLSGLATKQLMERAYLNLRRAAIDEDEQATIQGILPEFLARQGVEAVAGFTHVDRAAISMHPDLALGEEHQLRTRCRVRPSPRSSLSSIRSLDDDAESRVPRSMNAGAASLPTPAQPSP